MNKDTCINYVHNQNRKHVTVTFICSILQIMRNAANVLILVTLELGGKYSFVDCEDVEAVNLANDSRYGLGCAVLSGSQRRARDIASLQCGNTAVNDFASTYTCQISIASCDVEDFINQKG